MTAGPTSKPILLWRERVGERIWFEAMQDDWGKLGQFVFLYCRARHPKLPERVAEIQHVWSLDMWPGAESPSLHYEKEEMLDKIRKLLVDLDAPEIHQQLTATMQALAVRLFFGESIFFQRTRFEELRAFGLPSLADIEHRIWEDLRIPVADHATWPAFSLPQRLTSEEIALFKRIENEAHNWFTWSEQAQTWKFLPYRAWMKLHQEWLRQTRNPAPYWNFDRDKKKRP